MRPQSRAEAPWIEIGNATGLAQHERGHLVRDGWREQDAVAILAAGHVEAVGELAQQRQAIGAFGAKARPVIGQIPGLTAAATDKDRCDDRCR